ncbi:hypothetical protein, partial [Mesorhizobium sp.]|uniref:hypothetical protein n=1 Tax=Mesorhizobium sp. TaxID=1871066 RepID=UPI0025B931CD
MRLLSPDRSHAPYSKRPASANACRKIDKNSNRFAVAFLLREVANQLWIRGPRGLGIGASILGCRRHSEQQGAREKMSDDEIILSELSDDE